MYHWGFDVSQVLISYALFIVIANILTETIVTIFILIIIFLTIFVFANLKVEGVISLSIYWKSLDIRVIDVLKYSGTFGIIAVLTWLSNL